MCLMEMCGTSKDAYRAMSGAMSTCGDPLVVVTAMLSSCNRTNRTILANLMKLYRESKGNEDVISTGKFGQQLFTLIFNHTSTMKSS